MAQTHIEMPFADGVYRFALGLAQIEEIQTKTGDGIGAVYARVLQGRMADDPSVGHPAYGAYKMRDLVETIRQGLIGGGEGLVDGQDVKVTALRANDLVDRYVTAIDAPISELWSLAAAILFAKIEGYAPAVEEAGDEADKKKVKQTRKRAASTTQKP